MLYNIHDIISKFFKEQKTYIQIVEKQLSISQRGNFSAIAINDQYFQLVPCPEFFQNIYRGQTKYYNPCKSSIYRDNNSFFHRFIERIRNVEFELLIKSHPILLEVQKMRIDNKQLLIDYKALAQHYGLKTELLDFTSDIPIAVFFACCDYDKKTDEYIPITSSDSGGVFYQYNYLIEKIIPQTNRTSNVVGLQPLPRPGEQSAFSVLLKKNDCLNKNRFVRIHSFKHDKDISNSIFEYFEGGNKIFPKTPVDDKIKILLKTKEFSIEAFEIAFLRFVGNRNKYSALKDRIISNGFSLVNDRAVNFTESEIKEICNNWMNTRDNFYSRIQWRQTYCG